MSLSIRLNPTQSSAISQSALSSTALKQTGNKNSALMFGSQDDSDAEFKARNFFKHRALQVRQALTFRPITSKKAMFNPQPLRDRNLADRAILQLLTGEAKEFRALQVKHGVEDVYRVIAKRLVTLLQEKGLTELHQTSLASALDIKYGSLIKIRESAKSSNSGFSFKPKDDEPKVGNCPLNDFPLAHFVTDVLFHKTFHPNDTIQELLMEHEAPKALIPYLEKYLPEPPPTYSDDEMEPWTPYWDKTKKPKTEPQAQS